MSVQEYVVRREEGLWKVWLDDDLLSGQPTQRKALNVAEALANAAIARGERSKILVEAVGGFSIEFPIIEPQDQPPVAR
jgi:hypothetical protein